MKVLVTGSGGFLGAAVARVLMEEGFQVTGFDQNASREGIPAVTGDLRDFDALLRATAGFDAVCHLAAIGDIYVADAEPGLASEVNVLGTANLMEAARRSGVKKVVHASTWEVYGSIESAIVEEQHPCRPKQPYNLTKLAAEQLALAYDRFHGVEVTALRMGTAYGPGMRTNAVIPLFVLKGLRGEPLTIQGDGSQQRQFTHSRDLGRAFARALRSSAHGLVLNTVAKEQVQIRELARLIGERYGVDVTFGPPRHGDPPPLVISSEAAKQTLGWEAEVPFAEGLRELMEYLEYERGRVPSS